MKLTRKKIDELCYQLWDWLYHHPSKEKADWPKWSRVSLSSWNKRYYYKDKFINQGCFYCNHYSCPNCPLGKVSRCTADDAAYFGKWIRAESPKTRKKYAKLIRDIAGKRLGK